MKLFKNRQLLTQAFEYLVSGGVYFWVSYITFALLWSGLGWSLWWAVIVSNLIGWIINYLMLRYWVFDSTNLARHRTQITGRYIFITLLDFLLSYLILYGLRRAGLTPYIGQFFSAGFFTVWNYFWYRFWVFPEKVAGSKTKIKLGQLVAHRPHGPGTYRAT